MNINLTPRLLAAARKVDKGERIADIGTDHGYVPIYLILSGVAGRAIACDINEGPLMRAYENIKKYDLCDKIELRLSDGFSNIGKDEADTALILGMGGLLIARILDNSRHTGIDTFILQPMQAQSKLREYLYNNNFVILDEELAMEGDKIYTIIKAVRGTPKKVEKVYYHIGEKLIENRDPLLSLLLDRKINEYEKIIKGQETGRGKADSDVYELLKGFKKIKDRMERWY